MSANLDSIFKPKTIAVIGASNKPGSIGNVIVNNLLKYQYRGKIYPVNPKADKIGWLQCYPSALDIPDEVDLAIIVVPRDFVKSSLEQCGEKGVKGIVAITAGFKAIGGEGIDKENDLIEVVKKYNMRMVGPNCYGVVNTDEEISLNSTFSKLKPLRGKIAFMSQSGALGEVVIDYTNMLNLGFSMFASTGNKADISDIDILEYWKDDPTTEIILLYLENIEQPQKFTKLAKEITRHKPIFAVKAGRTAAGAKAISSHTGVLAGGDTATDAVFKQCGIIRIDTIDELFDVAQAFAAQPLLKGDRIAVITNAGGPGILATDAVEGLGLKMAKFEQKTIEFLKLNLQSMAAVTNPIDVIASGGPDAYGAAMEAVLTDKNVDGVIVIFVPPILVDSKAVLKAIADRVVKFNNNKTVLACLMGSPQGIAGSEQLTEINVPFYLFPESAARAMKAMTDYREVIDRPIGKTVKFTVKKDRANQIVEKALKDNHKAILGDEALKILSAYGIGIPRSATVKTQKELTSALAKLKLPVAMKIDDPSISHKTDVGGVVVNLTTKTEVIDAFKTMRKKFGVRGHKSTTGKLAHGDGRYSPEFAGVFIQQMVTDGTEIIMGMSDDPSFGPLIMFGLGGIHVEVLKDVAFKVHPLTDRDAAEMIYSVKGYPLLTGFRGASPVDIKVLQDTLLRLSQLVTDFPQFKSLDINPFIAGKDAKHSIAVDARFILSG